LSLFKIHRSPRQRGDLNKHLDHKALELLKGTKDWVLCKSGPDLVNLKHVAPLAIAHEKADEVNVAFPGSSYLCSELIYFLRNGIPTVQPLQEEALASARLIFQAFWAMVSSVEKQIAGQTVILLAGATGAGKSALSNWLIGNKLELLEPEKNRIDHTISVSQETLDDFAVGHSRASTTFLPKAVKVREGVFLVDFPGFFDTTNVEMQIAIDLSFQKVIELASKVHVLALADVASVAGIKGDGFKRQLVKLKRHLPLQHGTSPFHFGITKADRRIHGHRLKGLLRECKAVLRSECPELPPDRIIDVNADWLFHDVPGAQDQEDSDDSDEDPDAAEDFVDAVRHQDVVEELLSSVAAENQEGCDCLDHLQVEEFGKQFRELGFLDFIHAKLSEIEGYQDVYDFIEDEGEDSAQHKADDGKEEDKDKCAGGSASSEGSAAPSGPANSNGSASQDSASSAGLAATWSDACKDMEECVANLNSRGANTQRATATLRSERKLLVQQVCEHVHGGEGVRWLCESNSLSFARLRKEMLTADKMYSHVHQKANLADFRSLGISINIAKSEGWLTKGDRKALEDKFSNVEEKFEQMARSQGHASVEAQCDGYVPVSTRLVAGAVLGGAAAGAWYGVGMGFVGGVASLNPCLGVGVVVGMGAFSLHSAFINGTSADARSRQLRSVFLSAMDALSLANTASSAHSCALQAYETEIHEALAHS